MAKDTAKKPSKDTTPAKMADAAPADTAKTDAPSSDTSDGGSSAKESANAKKASGGSRPISYFSSVSTEEYRSGWDDIFGSKKKAVAPKRAKSKLPATLSISVDDLDADAQAALESVARKLAKKKRLNFDKLQANGQIEWRIACEISDA